MELSPMIAQVWGNVGWLIPLMLLPGPFKWPWFKRGSAFLKCKTMQSF